MNRGHLLCSQAILVQQYYLYITPQALDSLMILHLMIIPQRNLKRVPLTQHKHLTRVSLTQQKPDFHSEVISLVQFWLVIPTGIRTL